MNIRIVAVAAAVTVGLAGCGAQASRGIQDSGIKSTDNSKAAITNFPDGYANVAFKCIGKDGVYVTTRDAAPQVVLNDSNCAS